MNSINKNIKNINIKNIKTITIKNILNYIKL